MVNDTLTDDGVAAEATYAPGALHPSDWAAIWLSSFILIVLVLTYLVTWIRRAMSVDKFLPYSNPDQSSYTTIFTLHSEEIEEDLPNTGTQGIDNTAYWDDELDTAPSVSNSRPGATLSGSGATKSGPLATKSGPSGTKSGPSVPGNKRKGSIDSKSKRQASKAQGDLRKDKVTLEHETKKPARPGRAKRQHSQERRASQRKTSPDKKRASKKKNRKPKE